MKKEPVQVVAGAPARALLRRGHVNYGERQGRRVRVYVVIVTATGKGVLQVSMMGFCTGKYVLSFACKNGADKEQ